MVKKSATEGYIPVYVPDTAGNPKFDIGAFKLKAGVMIIEFEDTLPAVTIQRMLDRGEFLGIQFVLLDQQKAEEAEEAEEAAAEIERMRAEAEDEVTTEE